MEPFGLHGIQALAAALIGKSGIVSILATVTDTVKTPGSPWEIAETFLSQELTVSRFVTL